MCACACARLLVSALVIVIGQPDRNCDEHGSRGGQRVHPMEETTAGLPWPINRIIMHRKLLAS